MEVNDRPETDENLDRFQGTGDVEQTVPEDDGEDAHVCRRCNIIFYDIQKYLEHKVKHDNFKVKYCRSDVDKRMIMPKLIQRIVKKEPLEYDTQESGGLEDEKENDSLKKKGRRGRKRISEVNQELVITEKPVYVCTKCDRKFNREATLRRHTQYDHNEDEENEEEEGEDAVEDDRDHDYKPKSDIKEEIMEGMGQQEMDSLDQVIMAAAMMEHAEAQRQGVSMVTPAGEGQGSGPPVKRQKLTEEEKASRKFVCGTCGNKFKEINVLKTHLLTHTTKRDYVCQYAECTYAFKTKGSLKRHMRRHTGERPYPCELCGRTFVESGALTRHLKSRTPCTTKSDTDLPRYGKKWTYNTNTPAAMGKTLGVVHVNTLNPDPNTQVEHPQMSKETEPLQLTKDTMIQQVSEDINVGLEHDEVATDQSLSPLTTVVRVLEDGVNHESHKELFDMGDPEGVEIVISGDQDVTHTMSDDSISQFVQTEVGGVHISLSTPCVCKVCKEQFGTVEALKIHLRTHLADTASRCWLCHFVSQNKEEFENHMFMHHHVQLRSNDPYTNLIPLERDLKQKDLDKDKNEVHRTAQVAVKQLLDLHHDHTDKSESGQTADRLLYKCPICQRQFRGSNYLKLHMRNHTGLRPHKCPQCGKCFITRDTLNKHITTHAEDRNFKCGECGKMFKRLSHVREHLKIHSGTRPFPCTVCEKTFKTNNAMKVHLRTHTDILPYECTYCHRRFREKGSVMRHTRMHTGEKPFECQYCGRGFAEHGTLNRHLKAKVSCNKQLQQDQFGGEKEDTDYTVLAEFSSVVADTQQYMVPGEGEAETVGQPQETQQAAEYVVLQTNVDGEEIQNVQIITDENGQQSEIEGFQVTDDFIVITDPDGSGMKILNTKTGETVAVVPVGDEGEDSQVQTITMSQEGEVSMVTMLPEIHTDQTSTIETYIGDENIIKQDEVQASVSSVQTVEVANSQEMLHEDEPEQGVAVFVQGEDTVLGHAEGSLPDGTLIQHEGVVYTLSDNGEESSIDNTGVQGGELRVISAASVKTTDSTDVIENT